MPPSKATGAAPSLEVNPHLGLIRAPCWMRWIMHMPWACLRGQTGKHPDPAERWPGLLGGRRRGHQDHGDRSACSSITRRICSQIRRGAAGC